MFCLCIPHSEPLQRGPQPRGRVSCHFSAGTIQERKSWGVSARLGIALLTPAALVSW